MWLEGACHQSRNGAVFQLNIDYETWVLSRIFTNAPSFWSPENLTFLLGDVMESLSRLDMQDSWHFHDFLNHL